MRVRTGSIGILSVALSLMVVAPAAGQDVSCVVADPTGTPLNVRTEPNGRIVMTLANGSKVRRVGERRQAGKGWALVSSVAGELGWVFAAYLDCVPVDGDLLKSAPMHPRPSGN
ncbi:SH3 domain-containing protein [Ensifer sp. 4252]|uniref:SH3 domain-containing protein n=1 Tax=Ensifer sp. 4252 TaxID=3373915 RepID=UPI003D23033D